MTHEPEDDAGSLADEIAASADAPTEQLQGIPVGEVQEAAFDYDPYEELNKATQGPDPDSLADAALQVVIQMGHVARTTGITGTGGEQDFARAAAGHTAARLAQDGRTVQVIGADDAVPRSEVFVAIHCDGNDNHSAHGASVGFRNTDGKRVADAWKEAYQRGGWSRGFRSDNNTAGLSRYYGTGKAQRAGTPFAFILEAGFLTNAEDRALLANDEGHARCAEAIRQAVSAVLGGGSVQPGTSPPFPGVVLTRGQSNGSDVCRVQARLRELGHSIDLKPNCPFGPQTEGAVKAFQRSRNLPDNGRVDRTTWDALFA